MLIGTHGRTTFGPCNNIGSLAQSGFNHVVKAR